MKMDRNGNGSGFTEFNGMVLVIEIYNNSWISEGSLNSCEVRLGITIRDPRFRARKIFCDPYNTDLLGNAGANR